MPKTVSPWVLLLGSLLVGLGTYALASRYRQAQLAARTRIDRSTPAFQTGTDLVPTPRYPFRPTTGPAEINWTQFPEFHLPERFKIVFQGAGRNLGNPLRYGFSHIEQYRMDSLDRLTVPARQQALMVYANHFEDRGIGFNNHRDHILDPFVDSDEKLVQALHDLRPNGPASRLGADLLLFDFENIAYQPDKSTLAPDSPGHRIPDDQFAAAYRQRMAGRYAQILRTVRRDVLRPEAQVGVYGPSGPVELAFHKWPEAAYIDPARKIKIWDQRTETGERWTDYNDFLVASSYFFYGRHSLFDVDTGRHERRWLPRLLTEVETNRRWSDKPLIPIHWLFYVNDEPRPVTPEMAEGLPIFLLLAGTDGLWLWDNTQALTPGGDPANPESRANMRFTVYEHFVHGLWRLSRHNAFLAGTCEAVTPEVDYLDGWGFRTLRPADFRRNDRPVVRALVNGDRILVAAHHYAARPNEVRTVLLKYKTWQRPLTLRGNEIFLGEARWR
jgi:hypothetical protein